MATLNLGRIKPVFRGAYSGSTAYVVDDIVTHGNESFICIQAHGAGTQATSVTAYWTKLAAKGTDGTDVGTTITAQGDILYRDGSGLQRLAKPASDKFLQNTSGGVLSWADAGGGAWTFLSKQTASDDTLLEWNSDITSTYDVYKLIISNAHSVNDSAHAYIQFRQSSSYLTGSNYRWAAGRALDNSTFSAAGSTSDNFIRITSDSTGNATGECWNFEITFWDLLGTDNYKQIHWNGANINQDGTIKQEVGAGTYTGSVAAMDGFKIYMSSNNIQSGQFALYGLKQA